MAEDGTAPIPARSGKRRSRIQEKNRKRILDAALDVFAAEGFRGATLDQIAARAEMSKPNMLYYFDSKAAIHVALLNALMESWVAPLRALGADDPPLEALMGYVHKKLEMSRTMPRQSRLFANEVLQGAPRMGPHLERGLKPLFEEKCALIRQWTEAGRIAPVAPEHLLMTIWAVTQHYADFEAQIAVLMPEERPRWTTATAHVDAMFRQMLTPPDVPAPPAAPKA